MFHPEAHERPAGERENKRHDSDEQVFPEPGQHERFAMRGFAESAICENPAGVQTDREPERGGLEAGVRQDAADREKGQETGREQYRVGELSERMRNRVEAREPAHSIVRRGLVGRLQEMHDREKSRGEKERAQSRKTAQQHAENEPTKKQFLQNRHDAGRDKHGRHFLPEKRVPQRIDMEGNDERAAAEERNRRNGKANRQIRPSPRIFFQSETTPAANPQRPQERPEQNQRSDEQGAVEIGFEIKPREAW